MEALERDYRPKGVAFYYVYKALAHPEYNRYVTPYSLEERLLHIETAKKTLGSGIPWLADTMDNQLMAALGNTPNPELLLDPEGKVVGRRGWNDPDALRTDLAKLLGPVEPPTDPESLNLPVAAPPKTVKTGIVPRPELPRGLRPLKIEPVFEPDALPFYVKLRAEATSELFDSGSGKLYLGFHLDPIYQVHWNNLVAPLSFRLQTPEGVSVAPATAKAPEVEEPADADPREFVLDIEAADMEAPMDLAVRYFACDDADTFCVPVTQRYQVRLERDRQAGTVFRGGFGGSPAGGGRPGGMMDRLMGFDKDGDGKLTRDEAPERMRGRFDMLDANGDGAIERQEIRDMMQRMGMGGGRRPNPPAKSSSSSSLR